MAFPFCESPSSLTMLPAAILCTPFPMRRPSGLSLHQRERLICVGVEERDSHVKVLSSPAAVVPWSLASISPTGNSSLGAMPKIVYVSALKIGGSTAGDWSICETLQSRRTLLSDGFGVKDRSVWVEEENEGFKPEWPWRVAA